ncbi:unnamed protein product [Arctia plantaginis]|uniref:Uncharacterized protein n=1 Tax=Arctia plantaginis TaxID=874455 RepID=A0A8S0YY77_ARCPL|nr:unnamed protein product [Arctia plantaginis]
MSDVTEIEGYTIVLIKLLREDISPDEVDDSDPIIVTANSGGTIGLNPDTQKDNKTKGGKIKRPRDKHRENFIPKGAIIRRGRVYMSNAPE